MIDPNDIADAVVSAINAIEWPEDWPEDLAYTAARDFAPSFKLHDGLTDLVVVVVPRKELRVRSARRSRRVKVTIEIGVMQKLPEDPAEHAARVEALCRLTLAIADFLGELPRLPDREAAVVLSDEKNPIEREPLYDVKLLRDSHQFASVIRVQIEEGETW